MSDRHNIELYFLVVNYNSGDLIKRLLDSLVLTDRERVVIVNNSPEDTEIGNLAGDSIAILEAGQNLGFGRACNLGLNWIYQQSDRAIVWLINPDTYFESKISPTSSIVTFFQQRPEISILGTTVWDSDGNLTSAGGSFTPNTAALTIVDRLPEDLTADYYQTDWVSGCSLLINLANFQELPQFDPRYFLYYEDLDFCLGYSQQGHQIAVINSIRVIHDTSSITSRNTLQQYRHITQSYLIHIEKYGSQKIFILTNIRMVINTVRLLIFKPQQGLGKVTGIYEYWRNRSS